MTVLRVKELRDILTALVEQGHGDKIVLVPNDDNEIDAEYRTVESVANDDYHNQCIYLETNTNEDENLFWENFSKKS
jgi:hypothetical protein